WYNKRKAVFQDYWDEEWCLDCYGMNSLHKVFEVVGTQLTDQDVEVLSFLLEESYPWTHPLDPTLWEVEEEERGQEEPGRRQAGSENFWCRTGRSRLGQRRDPTYWDTSSIPKPKNGVELLLELERRGRCDESNFRHLLQLLRILSRHDLLAYVTQKKPRTVSPERYTFGPTVLGTEEEMDNCLTPSSVEQDQDQWEMGEIPNSNIRKRGARGVAQRRNRRKGAKKSVPQKEEATSQSKVTCEIKLRVRAEFCEHHTILRENVASNKQDPMERRFDVFNQSCTVLKSRDLGSIICGIKFSELSYLDSFWCDYLNGSLLEALRGVFITDSLKQAVGQEAIRLLVNVDEEDYEEGRRLLLQGCVLPFR
uniref:Death effector domain containing 2 n=1 Tax=Latimeria chalumnae TaxID=7897 RepID=H3AF90_LATCH